MVKTIGEITFMAIAEERIGGGEKMIRCCIGVGSHLLGIEEIRRGWTGG